MLLSFFSTLWLAAFGQITVTSSTFPSAGDTLKFARDTETQPTGFLTPPGGGQVWDFSNLQIEQTFNTVYQNAATASNVAQFPGAALVTVGNNGAETFYRKSATKFETLGYAGADPGGVGLNVVAKFQPPVTLRYSPMKFFDINQQTTNLTLPFSVNQLPDSLIPGVPGLDSIRFRINYQRLDVVDAWGKLSIPGGTYDVLREKRTEYTSTAMDVKIGFLGWIDVSNLGGGGSGGFGNFLGTDTTVMFRFYSATEKEEIAIVTLNNEQNEVNSTTFKNVKGTSDTDAPDAPGKAAVQALPNPAVEFVRFYCTNLPPNHYTLKIYNIVGKPIWQQQDWMQGDKEIFVELDNFKKGPYLYSLTDADGKVVSTKRLVVLKP